MRPPPLRPYAPPPRPLPPRRTRWPLRLAACGLSALAFLGFWQAAGHSSNAAPSSQGGGYAPPSGAGGLVLPGQFGGTPNGGTHVS